MRDLCLGFWHCRLLLMLEEGLLMRIWIHLDRVPVLFLLDGKGLDEQIYAFSTVFAAVMANLLRKYHDSFIMIPGTAVHEIIAVEIQISVSAFRRGFLDALGSRAGSYQQQ